MRILSVHVENFRNLTNVSVDLHKDISYIIGENNIGKSNFLDVLQIVCNGWSIDEKDYADPDAPITVTMKLILAEEELGIFGDEFSPEDANSILIRYIKPIDDPRGSYVNVATGESIQTKTLRNINYFRYDSTQNPSNDLRFDKQRGVGPILSHIISKYVSEEETYLNHACVSDLLGRLNSQLKLIKAFDDYGIHANISPNSSDMLSRLIYLMDEKLLPIQLSGNGVQYSAIATVNVINRIIDLYNSKTYSLDSILYTKRQADSPLVKKILPMVFAVDEPEIHLHPFMQRSLISYYKRIMNNDDENFLELIKTCFDIDGIDGQLVVVTHSTDALMDNFRNIVRFYKNMQLETAVLSGVTLSLEPSIEKHLIAKFPDVKEAFYSRCVILVEGATEYGCMRLFANELGISLDDLGICIINAGGAKSIKPLSQLFASFMIPSVLVYDGDVITKNATQNTNPNEFYTREPCLEMEIVKKLIASQEFALLESIPTLISADAMTRIIQPNYFTTPLSKFNASGISVPQKLADINRFDTRYEVIYASWLYKQKDIISGRIIGSCLSAALIPDCYKQAIARAKEVANSVEHQPCSN